MNLNLNTYETVCFIYTHYNIHVVFNESVELHTIKVANEVWLGAL